MVTCCYCKGERKEQNKPTLGSCQLFFGLLRFPKKYTQYLGLVTSSYIILISKKQSILYWKNRFLT